MVEFFKKYFSLIMYNKNVWLHCDIYIHVYNVFGSYPPPLPSLVLFHFYWFFLSPTIPSSIILSFQGGVLPKQFS